MSTQTQDKPLVKATQQKKELKDWLQGEPFKRELAALLPRTMSPERFVRIAFQAVHRNNDLLKCSQESFFNCLLSLGAMGLEPDGRNAHLIPFKDECTLIVDYKGIAELLRRNRDVLSLHCDVVYTADEYEAEQGTNQHLMHKKARGERGAPFLAYSFVRLPDGSQEFEEMSIAEIEAIRKRSKTPNKGPWVTDWDAMARKTVFRRHAKMLPLSPATRDALERDADGDSLAQAQRVAPIVSASVLDSGERKRMRKPLVEAEGTGLPLEESQDMAAGGAGEPADASLDAGEGKTAAEPAKAIPGHPELLDMVRAQLNRTGYAESELIAILKAVRLAQKEVNQLADCSDHALSVVLEEWDNAEMRMREARAKAKAND